MAITGERNTYIAAHVTPEVHQTVKEVAGNLGVSAFVSEALINELRRRRKSDEWYLAGPMTGIPECNYPAFEKAAAELRVIGYKIHAPNEACGTKDDSLWLQYLRKDLGDLVLCKGIILLQGWEKSKGARLELSVALSLDMPVCLWQHGQVTPITKESQDDLATTP